jgi:hypothetical protein
LATMRRPIAPCHLLAWSMKRQQKNDMAPLWSPAFRR